MRHRWFWIVLVVAVGCGGKKNESAPAPAQGDLKTAPRGLGPAPTAEVPAPTAAGDAAPAVAQAPPAVADMTGKTPSPAVPGQAPKGLPPGPPSGDKPAPLPPGLLPPGHPPIAGVSPTPPGAGAPPAGAGTAAAATKPQTIKGKVLERTDAPPYSYLKLKTTKGEVWAAVPQTKRDKGADVTITNAYLMEKFESKTLHRTFDQIYFGKVEGEGPAPAAGGGPAAPGKSDVQAGSSNADMQKAVGDRHRAAGDGPDDTASIHVDKAAGPAGHTVAEVHASAAKLKDQAVEVRAKVVKVNLGIMGKNWVHVRDGTGSHDAGTNDLTVTTKDAPAVGDVVLVKGTLRTNKDFGAGYTYAVIVEDAAIVK